MLWNYALALLMASQAAPQQLVATPVPGYFDRAVYVTAPAFDERLFVVLNNLAQVQIVEQGVQLATPFLDIANKVLTGNTQGLLCLAFHPRYAENGYAFVYYTDLLGDVVIERYTVSASDPNRLEPASAIQVLKIPQPFQDNNGGQLAFGPDGFLYIGVGDGGGVLDPFCYGQDLSVPLGKVLRIDVDSIDQTGAYSIPPGNPFVGLAGVEPAIWHFGLEQPWRFAFDRRNGGLWIGDVGENTAEEINRAAPFERGLNFGWQVMEGQFCSSQISSTSCLPPVVPCGDPSILAPFIEYPHDFANWGCAVMAGYVYDGWAMPALRGTFFFADYCTGRVWSLDADQPGPAQLIERSGELFGANPPSNITSFGRDGFGELYITSLSGLVYRIGPADGALAPLPKLVGFEQALSIADGGQQELLLNAGASHAGEVYLLLGSASGTSPGIPLGIGSLDLVPDAYFAWLLGAPNQTLAKQALGLLDGQGRARARIEIPAGQLPLAAQNQVLHHAYVTLGSAPGASILLTLVSNAVPLALR
jgi:hypothetical protein